MSKRSVIWHLFQKHSFIWWPTLPFKNFSSLYSMYMKFSALKFWVQKNTFATKKSLKFCFVQRFYRLHPIYSRFWYAFSMLKLTKFPPPCGRCLTFYYTSHDTNRIIPHVHRARLLNGFENGPNLAENRIEYVLLTTWDVNSIFFSANRARPGSQKLPLNGFTEWNFLRNKEKAYQNRE